MKKKIAVIVRERTEEALRMALGLTLENDQVDVYLLSHPPADTEMNAMNVEMLRDVRGGLYSIIDAGGAFTPVERAELPERLLSYDHVIPY